MSRPKAGLSQVSTPWPSRVFLSGQAVSLLGDGLAVLAIPLLVLDLTRSPLISGLSAASMTLGYLAVGLPAGVLVDRLDAWRVLVTMDTARTAAFAALYLLWVTGAARLWVIMAIALAAGAASVFFETGPSATTDRPGCVYYARRMAGPLRRYRAHDEDSARWTGFPFRDDDIVISTRSKTGTTWVQMICALLILQQPPLPAPLAQLSPWLDHLIAPRDQVFAQLAAQEHRRFIKTHTPLDGIPLDPRVTYIVTARHPLDVAVSLYHHSGNIDRARLRRLTGQPEPAIPPPPLPPLREWLLGWIADDHDPVEQLDSFPGLMWHLSDAWARRGQPNVLLVHYDNLSADLTGQMRWLAGRLGITVPGHAWPALIRAATFESMSGNADAHVPTAGLFKSNAAFFRRGTPGAGREILTDRELAAYHDRAAQLAPADMLTWLHSPGR